MCDSAASLSGAGYSTPVEIGCCSVLNARWFCSVLTARWLLSVLIARCLLSVVSLGWLLPGAQWKCFALRCLLYARCPLYGAFVQRSQHCIPLAYIAGVHCENHCYDHSNLVSLLLSMAYDEAGGGGRVSRVLPQTRARTRRFGCGWRWGWQEVRSLCSNRVAYMF